ncbi:hypothetical protein B0H14DRAFT_2599041 [Mycena olivaceomarginata]|nr:hypothetical protein B0H14DRAFT_2599041 [Mycena olivaceomarginata]
MSLHLSPEEPKHVPKNDFDEYLKTRTPGIPDSLGAEANTEAIDNYEEELISLFLTLVKRSVFLTLNDEEQSVISAIIDLIDELPGGQPSYHSMFRKFATIACTRRWQDPERTNHLFIEFLCKHKISVFGHYEDAADEEDSSSESSEGETDDESVAKKISQFLPPLTEPSGRPQVPDFSKDGALDSYSNNVQDKFFSLTKAADSEALTKNETRELMYFYTILRLVDHSVPNHKIYTILYENCIGKKDSLDASNLNETYQQSSERGYDSTNPSLNRTFYAELLHWRGVNYNLLDFCTKIDMKEVKVLGSNPNGKAMESISDDENEGDMARKKMVPIIPKLPRGLSGAEMYNFQQKLEPDARAVLMRAVWRKLGKREEKYFAEVLRLLRGHPSHGRISHLFGKAKVGKLTTTDMVQLRAMAGNGEAGERGNDVDEDVEMPSVDGTDNIDFLKSMICDLGAWAENSGTVLEKINEHAKEGIHIHHIPLYHTSTSASKNPSTPKIYSDEFGNLATFLRGTPAASLKNFPDSAEIHLALLLTALESTQGVSHMNQLCRPTHTVIVGIVHTCNPKSRALLVWDVNILRTEPNKTKESLDTSTRDALRRARNNDRCPKFQTFWINEGQKRNHDNICLELTLKEILRIACEGLRIGKGEDGAVQKIPGFIKVDDD